MKNFIYILEDYLKQLELDYPVGVGIFDDEESLLLKPIEGSEVIHRYMNGTMDIRLPFEISIKSKNQEEAFSLLSNVIDGVQKLDDFLKEESGAPILIETVVNQTPILESKDEDGYFYYTSKLTVDLTVT